MNWYNTFYWLTRADSIKSFFDFSSNLFTFFSICLFIVVVIMNAFAKSAISDNGLKSEEEEKNDPDYRGYVKMRSHFSRLFYVNLFLCLITWAGYIFTPTKKETLLIIAAGGTMQFLTTDSVAKQLPHEISSFVVNELKSMAKEAQVDLGISSQKDKILEEAKNMTAEQVLERMKADTNFAKVVLDK